jgi:N-sulfoglucosamine sulfohydrolase
MNLAFTAKILKFPKNNASQRPPRFLAHFDETPDHIRAVRDTRYKYIRNFQPELPYAQKIAYMEEMATMQEWRRLHAEGKLTGPQKIFFTPTKP